MSQEQSVLAENYTKAEKALEVLAMEMQNRVDAMISRTQERLRELFAPESTDRLDATDHAIPFYNPHGRDDIACPVAKRITWMCRDILALGQEAKEAKRSTRCEDSRLLNINDELLNSTIHTAISGKPQCIKLEDRERSMSLDQIYGIAESTLQIIKAGLEGSDPRAVSYVIRVICDIREFLRKSVQHGIFMPVIFDKGVSPRPNHRAQKSIFGTDFDSDCMVSRRPYILNVQETLRANGIDYQEVDNPSLSLGDFVDKMMTVNRYICGLTINGKKIVKVRPLGECFVYGEGRAVVIATDSDGKEMVLKFIAQDASGSSRIMSNLGDSSPSGRDPVPDVDALNKEFDILTAVSPTKGVPRAYEKGIVEIDGGGKLFYIAEEYFEGESLDKLLLAKNIPLRRVIRIISSLLSVVGSLHSKGYVYRDVSPRNILVSDKGDARICDFGIAEEVNKSLGRFKQGTGTPGYISSEDGINNVLFWYANDSGHDGIVEDGLISGEFEAELLSKELIAKIVETYYCPRGQVSHPVRDIYAAGVLLHELLGGKREHTFTSKRKNIQMKDILCDDLVIGQQLVAIIKKATAMDYRQRYQSAAEMLADIEKIELQDV